VGIVAIHNRIDTTALCNRAAKGNANKWRKPLCKGDFHAWLSLFEVWVGDHPGDVSSSAVRCGDDFSDVEAGVGPFTTDCEGADGKFVTLRYLGGARYLTIAEMQIFEEPLSPPPSLPPSPRPPPAVPSPVPPPNAPPYVMPTLDEFFGVFKDASIAATDLSQGEWCFANYGFVGCGHSSFQAAGDALLAHASDDEHEHGN